MIKSLSVFFPAYNEEDNLTPTVEKAVKVLKDLKISWELIIVDDGSKDKTPQIADDLAKRYPGVRVIHQPNGGYGEALKTGFYNSKNDWIAFNDSDGQFDFSEITKFIELSDKADLIAGYRMNRQDPLMRKLNGWGWTMINNLLFGIHVRDVDCAFKLIKKEVFQTIPHLESTRGAMISPELLARTKKAGFTITEVGVTHYPRLAGNPTGASIKVILKSFADLFKLWLKLR